MPCLLLDTNVLILLVVGAADRSYIRLHRRLQGFDEASFDLLMAIVDAHDGIVTTPHVLTEASNLSRQIRNPARDRIQQAFRDLVHRSRELDIRSVAGCDDEQFTQLGLTDAVILRACERGESLDPAVELLTADEGLYDQALARGLPATQFL